MKATDEQFAIVDRAVAGESLKGKALAGTGKTSTEVMVARAMPRRQMVYITFNKALAVEGKQKFPGNVTSATAHSLAFRDLGHRFRSRLGSAMMWRYPLKNTYSKEVRGVAREFARDPNTVVWALMGTIENFQQSAAQVLLPEHVPIWAKMLVPDGAQGPYAEQLATVARQVWEEMAQPQSTFPVTHDTYLKLWQLSGAKLNADVILFDEAQDANAVMLAVVEAQEAQRIYVGDQNQQIYAWRGAVNAMTKIALPEFPLTQSFRFGPHIAEIANSVLAAKGETLALRGLEGIEGVVYDDPEHLNADAVLCRSNVGVVKELESALKRGVRTAVLGGVDETCKFMEAAYAFSEGEPTSHPELRPFNDWEELVAFSETDQGHAYAPVVRLVDMYQDRIPELAETFRANTVNEREAELTISTAHKAKGMEWPSVRLSDDFRPFADQADDRGLPTFEEEEANLIYVALTRAQSVLNTGGFEGALHLSLRCARDFFRIKAAGGLPEEVANRGAMSQRSQGGSRKPEVSTSVQGRDPESRRGSSVVVPAGLMVDLSKAAIRLGLSVDEYATRILTEVVKGH